ncbi:DUF2695 domain-containing protein [Arthrobacter sp. NIO-1057]|uniref:DUF2695 domain-containing protein n=1 Tax=Arthrobacter sp. NIO-1057 TaxID=993071 RepID=UPI0008181512|nr:Protein of unknown function [Arthrobacter sp. NIO-1057]
MKSRYGDLRVSKNYRDISALRVVALEKDYRLGGYCDCEVLINVLRPITMQAHSR